MARRKKTQKNTDGTMPQVENPSLFPAYVIVGPPPNDINIEELRGGPWFDLMASMGLRVDRINNGNNLKLTPQLPWTYVFMAVPEANIVEAIRTITSTAPVSIVLDCYFPIFDMANVVASADTLQVIGDAREDMIANLRAACAVTTPRQEWAADMAEAGINTWLLPDINPHDESTVASFGVRFAEVMAATYQACVATRRREDADD